MVPRRLTYIVLAIVVTLVVVICVGRARARHRFKFPRRTLTSVPVRFPRQTQSDVSDDGSSETTTTADVAASQVVTVGDLHQRLLGLCKGKSSRQRMDAVFELGKTLGAEDFDHALALMKQVPIEWMRSVLCSGIFFSRGRSQGRQTLDVEGNFYNLPGFDDRFAAGGAIIGWASADPVAALAFAQEKDNLMLPCLAYAAWGLQDLDAALAHANMLPPGMENVPGQDDFLGWAKSDSERAVEYAITLDESLRPTVLERIAHGWASNWSENYQPDFTSYLYIAVNGNSDDFISDRVTLWWAQYEPQAAVEDSAGLDPKNDRDKELRAAWTCWAEADPGAAMQWWNDYSLQHADGRELGSRIIDDLAAVNPEKASQMLDSTPALADDVGLRSEVLSKWMEWDARAAFDWIAVKHLDHETMIAASRSVAVNLSQWSLDDGLDWARNLSDASLCPDALSGVALVQGYAAPERSTDWIRDLPTGLTRDQSIFGYVSGVLDHATGSNTPDKNILDQAEANLPKLASMVQDSTLDEREKQRLLGLIYGWPAPR